MTTPSKIQTGSLIVPTPGTALPLASVTTPCAKLTISADDNNANPIVVGDANVVAAVGASRRGNVILPGGSVAYDIDDLSKVFVDVITSNDKVIFSWTS